MTKCREKQTMTTYVPSAKRLLRFTAMPIENIAPTNVTLKIGLGVADDESERRKARNYLPNDNECRPADARKGIDFRGRVQAV